MKALELLNTISTEWCNEYANNAIDLAIKELEELENRSCESCKYWNYQFTYSLYKSCTFGLIEHSYEESSFSCNRWESK